MVFEQTGWVFYWLDGKIPFWPMQTVFCFRSVLLYKLFLGGRWVLYLTSNMDKISDTARGMHAEVRLWPCVH